MVSWLILRLLVQIEIVRCEIAAGMIFPINLKENSRPVNQQPDLVGCLPPKRFWSFNPCMGVLGSNIGFGEADQPVIHNPIWSWSNVNLGPARKKQHESVKGKGYWQLCWDFLPANTQPHNHQLLLMSVITCSFAHHDTHHWNQLAVSHFMAHQRRKVSYKHPKKSHYCI